jgi:CBS domain-containing protein
MHAPDDVSVFLRRIGELVRRAPVTCDAAASAADIARVMSREGVGSVLVLADGRPIGIVTDRDLRRKVVAEGRDARTAPASELQGGVTKKKRRKA